MDTERTENKGEQLEEPTSEKEQETKATSQEESTSEEGETFSQGQLDEAVLKGKGEVQGAKDKEIQKLNEQLTELNQKASEFNLNTLEAKEIDAWGETDEVKQFHGQRRKLQGDILAYEKKQVILDAIEGDMAEEAAKVKAKELASQYGIGEKELLAYHTPEEMESAAIKFGFTKVIAERDELAKKSQKIDSSAPSATGVAWQDLSPSDKVRRGLQK